MASAFDILLIDTIESIGESSVTRIHQDIERRGWNLSQQQVAGHIFWSIRSGYIIEIEPKVYDVTSKGHDLWTSTTPDTVEEYYDIRDASPRQHEHPPSMNIDTSQIEPPSYIGQLSMYPIESGMDPKDYENHEDDEDKDER